MAKCMGPVDPPLMKKCPDCDGTGVFIRDACVVDGISYPAISGECETCDGYGDIEDESHLAERNKR